MNLPPEIEAEIAKGCAYLPGSYFGATEQLDAFARRIARMVAKDTVSACEPERFKAGGGAVGIAMDIIRTRYGLGDTDGPE